MSTTSNENKRLAWLDFAKAFAMILVLIGHSIRDEMRTEIPVLDFIYRSVYIFHMAYFFWLSGYGYALSRKRKEPFEIARKRWRTQFAPWLAYTLFIYLAFTCAMLFPGIAQLLLSAGYMPISLLAYLRECLLANNPWAYHLWFLYMLFVMQQILCLADGLSKGEHTRRVCMILLCTAIVFMTLRDFVALGDWWRLYNYLSLHMPMLCLGVLMAKWKPSRKWLWPWALVAIAYIAIRALFFSGFSGNSLRVGGLARACIYLLGYLLLPGLMLALNRIFEKGLFPITRLGQRLFGFIGRDSLYIYLAHQPFCCGFLGLLLTRRHANALAIMAICLAFSLLAGYALASIARCIHRKKENT